MSIVTSIVSYKHLHRWITWVSWPWAESHSHTIMYVPIQHNDIRNSESTLYQQSGWDFDLVTYKDSTQVDDITMVDEMKGLKISVSQLWWQSQNTWKCLVREIQMTKEENLGAHENENGEDEYDDNDKSKNKHVCMYAVCCLIHSSNVTMVEAVLPNFNDSVIK